MPEQETSQDLSTLAAPEGCTSKRRVSERKIQANRRNALRSTGPKTTRGKRTVARNAIKHGFLAREVVITTGDGQETREDFDALTGRLCEHYKPVGVLEEFLVQTIATCLWRKARVIRAENGEIRKRLDTLVVDSGLERADKANLDLAITDIGLPLFSPDNEADGKLASLDRWMVMQAVQQSIRGHSPGLNYLTALLQVAKAEMTSHGHISEETCRRILDAFGFLDHVFARTCLRATIRAKKPATEARDQLPNPILDEPSDQIRSMTVALIDFYLEKLQAFEKFAAERERLETDAETRRLSLPDGEATDKLIRYEAHLDKQLYRAMDQLERLQRQRQGENVPPPLNINLGRRG